MISRTQRTRCRSTTGLGLCVLGLLLGLSAATAAGVPPDDLPAETPAEAQRRHELVAQRRSGVSVISHRGASEFAHENTLEAYRATFELGGDGNEIDIRSTRDGVLVCFHDDMLDRLTDGWGDVSDLTWDELQRLKLTSPGRFGPQARIPRLIEVLALHRQVGGLLHLDIKRPGFDQRISDLLTRLDLWDHVASCNADTGGVIVRDPRFRPQRYRGGLYQDRSEVFPDAIQRILDRPGDSVIVDDPRGVLLELGRPLGRVSRQPVVPLPGSSPPAAPVPAAPQIDVVALLSQLRDADDWNLVAESDTEQRTSADRIRVRAQAARLLGRLPALAEVDREVLRNRVRNRSLHKNWMWHGLDGAFALKTLLHVPGPSTARDVELARFVVWRDDPHLAPVVNPEFKSPSAWTDFRVKMVVFPALAGLRDHPAAAQLCRDYLALTDDAARELGPAQFKEAAESLLGILPTTGTALELLEHRLQEVRGQAVLCCLRHSSGEWAREALERGAPHALRYLVLEE